MAPRKRQEAELDVAVVKMLRFSLGVMRMDRIRNENNREIVYVRCFACRSACTVCFLSVEVLLCCLFVPNVLY